MKMLNLMAFSCASLSAYAGGGGQGEIKGSTSLAMSPPLTPPGRPGRPEASVDNKYLYTPES